MRDLFAPKQLQTEGRLRLNSRGLKDQAVGYLDLYTWTLQLSSIQA